MIELKNKINNKGFTLIELLAALVILTVIMGIAIPSISSSLERTKEKQNQSRIKVLESAAELYVTDHKNAIYNKLGTNDSCYINLYELDVSEDNKKDSDGNDFSGVIVFNKLNGYKFTKTEDIPVGLESCK